MAELNLLWAIFKAHGLTGAVIAFLVIYHFIYPMWKKSKGGWVSYEDLDGRMTKLETKHDEFEKRVAAEFQHAFQQHKTMFEKIDKLEER